MPPRARRPHKPSARRYSRTHPPADLEVRDWQVALRRQFGREQAFKLENLGKAPVFSEFRVTNPASGGRYRVAIRGAELGENYCACPDFATNDLGTCKHVEFVLGRLERRRGGKAALARGFAPAYSEVWVRYGAARQLCFRPGRRCPAPLLRRARALFDAANGWILPPDRYAELATFIAACERSRHEVRIYDDARALAAYVQQRAARQAALAAAFPRGARSAGVRDVLAVPLYPYQCEGAWFAACEGRAIIADDMGLGKTVQAVAAAELLIRHAHCARVLVVCPTSLKHQWQSEIARLTGREALIIGGSRTERSRQYTARALYKITNYDTLHRDLELIGGWAPDLVVADEAQRIKNWDTRAARALKRVASPHALVLTGTPLENRLQELLSVVQFIDQHRLGPTWRFLATHQIHAESGQVTGYQRLDEVAATLAPILMRRRKAEVLTQLPPRSDKTYRLPLTPVQRALHEEHGETVARIVARWRQQRHLSDADQKRLMAALQSMRMVCDSSYLLDPKSDHGTKLPELVRVLDEALAVPDTKVVLFSAWLRAHELIAQALDARRIGHVLFYGGVPAARRGQLIARFRDDPACRVFLATDAGGVGLNLQWASVVVNFDLPWNPAVLEQRIGRVHRLGQQRPVRVLNFVAEASIEENLLGLLAFKQALAAGVLDGGAKEVRLGGTRLARFMEGVERVITSPAPAPLQPPPRAPVQPVAVVRSARTVERPPTSSANPAPDPWRPLVTLAEDLLADLARPPAQARWVREDAASGTRQLVLPAPEPEVLQTLVAALRQLFGAPRAE